jgi:SNF2 family DNA or RNA helicase
VGAAVQIEVNEEIVRASGKFELIDRMLPKLQRTGRRVLVFCQMTKLMDIMEQFLRYRGYTFLRIDGAVQAAERKERLELFNRRARHAARARARG